MIRQDQNLSDRPLTFRRSLQTLRSKAAFRHSGVDVATVKDHFQGFVHKLQQRYPFVFATAYRNLESESNKQIQERLASQFLFGAIAEMTPLSAAKKDTLWRLGRLLSKSIRKGGENFRPVDFTPEERLLAQQIGPKDFELLVVMAEQLSLEMKFKLGPVNSAEHVMAWCFRYVRLFLESAKWQTKHPEAVLPK